jgi:hypothetical protein
MILLATCAVLSAAARETQASGTRPHQGIPVQCIGERMLSIVQSPLPHPVQPTAGRKFSSRRYRLKSVLEETHRRTIEETDLGPVLQSVKLLPFLRNELAGYLQLVTPPLRC